MEFVDRETSKLSWKRVCKNHKESFSYLTNTDSVKICTCCGSQFILVKNEREYALIQELNKESPLVVPFAFIAGNKSAAFKKLANHAEEMNLPIKCSYISTEYADQTAKQYKVSGEFQFELAAKQRGKLPCLKGICPYCNHKYDEFAEEKIDRLCEKDYDKLIQRYRSKAQESASEPDVSKLDVKEYLGTLIELYKESYILEKQIKSFLHKKYVCNHAKAKEKGLFIVEMTAKSDDPQEYLDSKRKLQELNEQISNGLSLSEEEKKAAWQAYIETDDTWKIYGTKLRKPTPPHKPELPEKPVAPAPLSFDTSRLIQPEEPVYGVGSFFNKKKIEKQNSQLRQKYEEDLRRYENACEEYEGLQREQVEKEAAYAQACIAYEEEVKHFEDALEQYNVLADRYAQKLQAFELQKQQKEQLASREKEVKAGVYAKALEEKKTGLLKEKEEIQRYLADYAVQQESALSEQAEQLPVVQRSTAAAMFIDGEIKSLAADLFAIYGAIDELNSLNIIYKKYQDFYVLCILYEYFLSGRVTELGGADGAYNLYESELKTNKILNKLDLIDEKLETIISKLDDIKESQVVLYEAMKEADQGIQKLNDSMEKLIGEFSAAQYSPGVLPTADLPAYRSYSTVIGGQHDRIGTKVQKASVIKRGILGGIIAGPAGAVVGALSAIDKNSRR